MSTPWARCTRDTSRHPPFLPWCSLNFVRRIELRRRFYGAVVLRGEGLHPDDTALVEQYQSNEPVPAVWTEAGLLHGYVMSDSVESSGRRVGVTLMWADVNFSRFAFDLLAMLNGTYRMGFASSFDGLEIRGVQGGS